MEEQSGLGSRMLLVLVGLGIGLFFLLYVSGGLPAPGGLTAPGDQVNATGFIGKTQVTLIPASTAIPRRPGSSANPNDAILGIGEPAPALDSAASQPLSLDEQALRTAQAYQVEQAIQTAQARTSQAFAAEQERTRQVFAAEQERTLQAFQVQKAQTSEALSAQETAAALQLTQTAGVIQQVQERARLQETLQAASVQSALQNTAAAATLAAIDVSLQANRTDHNLRLLMNLIQTSLYLSLLAGCAAIIRCLVTWSHSSARVRETLALVRLYSERRRLEELRLYGRRKPWVQK